MRIFSRNRKEHGTAVIAGSVLPGCCQDQKNKTAEFMHVTRDPDEVKSAASDGASRRELR